MGIHREEGDKHDCCSIRFNGNRTTFPNFQIVDEFTGLVCTIVAIEDEVKYWDYIGKDYAAYLKQQKIAS